MRRVILNRKFSISIKELAEFLRKSGSIDARFSGLNRAQEGGKIHRMLQKQAGKNYKAEVSLSMQIEQDGIEYTLSGRADGIIATPSGFMVDEIKTTTVPLESIEKETFPAHWAQGTIYAYIWCQQNSLEEISLQLTYYNVNDDSIKRIEKAYIFKELQKYMEELLKEYRPWAQLLLEWREKRNASLQEMIFPFAQYREGQRKLAVASYRTFQNGERLLACAPTGIGKTISTVFPAMKAMGEGYGERIFYLTAKTITRTAAQETIHLLKQTNVALQFKNITLTAKDKICMLEERNCIPEVCPYANGYYDRINDTLFWLLNNEMDFTREKIEEIAEKNQICPFELSLDLSSWCDCVICDYNYLFDPVVKLQRFFESTDNENLFLIDEAHNLPDRAREMHSAKINKNDFYDFKKELPKQYKRLHTGLKALNDGFVALRHRCNDEGTKSLKLINLPDEFKKPIDIFIQAAEDFLENHLSPEYEKDLLSVYFEALFYRRISEEFSEAYSTLVFMATNNNVVVKLFCMDPSEAVNESLKMGRAAVFFSATLLPLQYYSQILGCESAKKLLLESPFKAENMELLIANTISTKYMARERSAQDIANVLFEFVSAKSGNYIAYFPSYAYMHQIVGIFEEKYPAVEILLQHSQMDEETREGFLKSFSENNTETLLGFCVLGGVFSEGINLSGGRLIGTAIVGVGLPQIGEEQDALREYYEEHYGDGFAFAYQFPGMNKVLQAAGRVIRTEEDFGVVLLIDERFTAARYRTIFPKHWAHWKATNPKLLPKQLQEFWEK